MIEIAQGTTYPLTLYFGNEPIVYKPITAKVSDTPLKLTVPTHGLPAAWPVAILNSGITELQPDDELAPDADDFYEATATDANTICLNEVDIRRLTGSYGAGGTIAYMTPVDLASCTAQLILYDTAGATALTISGTLDNTAKTIAFEITAVQSAGLTLGTYTYIILFTDATSKVTSLEEGKIKIYRKGSKQPSCQ